MGLFGNLFGGKSWTPEQAINTLSDSLIGMVRNANYRGKLREDLPNDKKIEEYLFVCETQILIMFLHIIGRQLENLPRNCMEQVMLGIVNKTLGVHIKQYVENMKNKYGIHFDANNIMNRIMSEADDKNQAYYKCSDIAGGPFLIAENTVIGELIKNIRPLISPNPMILFPLATQISEQLISTTDLTLEVFKNVR